jgi:hypothetical protein
MDASFHGGLNETLAAVSDFGCRVISLFLFEVVLPASGVSNQGVWGVYGRLFSWRFE